MEQTTLSKLFAKRDQKMVIEEKNQSSGPAIPQDLIPWVEK